MTTSAGMTVMISLSPTMEMTSSAVETESTNWMVAWEQIVSTAGPETTGCTGSIAPWAGQLPTVEMC